MAIGSAVVRAGGEPSDLHRFVLDALGPEICNGVLPTGTVFTMESVEERFRVSRPVIREALRGLQTLGLIESKRRVGVTVQPLARWNVLDSQVIRWRLAGPGRVAQLRSLTELRSAVEPAAARMAASQRSDSDASHLVSLSGRLWQAGEQGDNLEFLRLDKLFHAMVLSMSGNEMFARMDHLVHEVLTGRIQYGLMPQYPAPEALQLHMVIATSIQSGEAESAASAMLAIMDRSMSEMGSIWSASSPESGHTIID